MAFPFPPNPVDGQQVSHTQPDGSVLSATYNASKNEWVVSRVLPAPTQVTSGTPITVTPTADRQVITWDAHANTWTASTVHPPRLSELADVEQGIPADGDILTYSAARHKWVRITRAQLAASLGIPPTTP